MSRLNIVPKDADGNPLDFRMFLLMVAAGQIPGFSFVNKFGTNDDVDTAGVPEDVWQYGGLYQFSTFANIRWISSSDDTDTQVTEVQGLDANWNFVTQTLNLTGQTPFQLVTPLVRIFRIKNVCVTDYAGNVYVYTDGAQSGGVPTNASAVRAMVKAGVNQTEMAIYTVPAGKTGYLLTHYVNSSRIGNNAAICTLRIRSFGGVFQVKYRTSIIGTGTSDEDQDHLIPEVLQEKTDILWRADNVDANDSGISAGFSILLEDN